MEECIENKQEASEEEVKESADSRLSYSEASESEILEATQVELEKISQNKKETASEVEEAREVENLKKLEAAMFIAGKWLSMPDLVMLTDLNPLLLRQLLNSLGERYSKENSALQIINKNDLWKMDVKEEHAEMASRLATGSSEFTKAEQETLAVIAYKQPVKQSVIIKIRGNKAYEHVKSFIGLGLLKAKRLGHTLELQLSEDFYNYFNLEKKESS